MTNFREKLVDRMIALYGFEHEFTVNFATHCEEWPDTPAYDLALRTVVEIHEYSPNMEEEEE